MTLPEKFAARVLSELGPEEGAALCAALDTEPPVSVRLNPAKCAGAAEPGAVQDGTGAAPGGYGSPQGSSGTDVPAPLPVLQNADGRVPWCADGYYLAVRPQFTFDSDFHAGAYYVQEASSQFVGRLMGGEGVAGKRILDLCAAPGGKTTLYASLAGPGGLVVANEIDRRRAQVLADNVRKWGTGNVAVTTCEPRQLGDFEAWFDMVAVALRKLPAVWDILQRLESIANLYAKSFAFTFNAVSDDITEVLFYCTPDNENYLVKACFNSVVNRIINNKLAFGAYRFQLLYTASKA